METTPSQPKTFTDKFTSYFQFEIILIIFMILLMSAMICFTAWMFYKMGQQHEIYTESTTRDFFGLTKMLMGSFISLVSTVVTYLFTHHSRINSE